MAQARPARPPRILLFAETFFPLQGGSERVAHNFATCLAENGWDPLVYCPAIPGDKEFDATVPYKVLRDRHWGDLRRIDRDATGALSRLVRLQNTLHSTRKLLTMRYDAIVAMHLVPMAVPLTLLPLIRRRPSLGWAYGEEIEVARTPMYRSQLVTSLTRATGIVAISRSTARACIQMGVKPRRIVLQFPTPDESFFTPLRPDHQGLSAQVHQDYEIAPGEVLLLTISRLAERKGIDTVLKALALVEAGRAAGWQGARWRYLIGGTGEDKPRLQQLAATLGIDDRVRFLGACREQEKIDLMEAADLFLMPNRRLESGEQEGFGIVFVEAALRGTPSIGGRSGGTSDALRHGTSGWLVDPSDHEALAAQLGDLLQNPAALQAMRPTSRQWAEDTFLPHLRHEPVLNRLRKLLRVE